MTRHQGPSDEKKPVTRRKFLRGASAAAGAAAALKAARLTRTEARAQPPGANERLGIGFIGCGGRGSAHIGVVQKLKDQGENVDLVAVCDIYGPRLEAAAKRTGGKAYRTRQELLADPNVDVVCIATPDRLHAFEALDAVRAGKDVYCEKPMTHWAQFDLAKRLAREVIQRERILQLGTQYMADSIWRQAAQLVKQGAIGKPIHAQAGYFRRGDWGERMPVPDPKATPGADLNWQAFLADAPKRPFDVSRFFQWRMYWDYSGGPSTDLFPHIFTPLAKVLGVTFPSTVSASGGKYHYDGEREVPDTYNTFIDYPEGLSVTLMCTLANAHGLPTVVRGVEGTMTFEGPGIMIRPPHGSKAEPRQIARERGGGVAEHWQNLLHCVRTREQPWSDVVMGYHVQTALNMGVLALRKRKVARFDAERERIIV
ncbi:MAG: Gfo/Idh/MocA family protein [Armatimonadota bacterium]